MTGSLTPDDVSFLNASSSPECVFVSAEGADLRYRCSLTSSHQTLAWGVLGGASEWAGGGRCA
jgi:hypothetical protein